MLSCLREACKNGHDAAAGLLIRRGALQDDLRSTEGTPLHDAARGGSAPCLELILESDLTAPQAGVPDLLDAADASGNTALMVAASLGNAEAATSLLRAGADADLYNGDQTASTIATGAACASFASPAERFWNASAAGNRAWRRRDFSSARRHFAAALQGAGSVEDGEAAPSEIDLARLELNCAKASLRLKDATAASDHARKAFQRHAAASNNSVYANAAAVLGECLELLYDFEGACRSFDDASKEARDERATQWRARASVCAGLPRGDALRGAGATIDSRRRRRAEGLPDGVAEVASRSHREERSRRGEARGKAFSESQRGQGDFVGRVQARDVRRGSETARCE